jgi:hypothetical protein
LIFPTKSKTTEFGPKTQGILGVNPPISAHALLSGDFGSVT